MGACDWARRARLSSEALVYLLLSESGVLASGPAQAQWRHENQRLNYEWGIDRYAPDDFVRPEFVGETQYDTVTHRFMLVFPSWKRCMAVQYVSIADMDALSSQLLLRL